LATQDLHDYSPEEPSPWLMDKLNLKNIQKQKNSTENI
jgi:hypothetical protein